MEVRGLKPTLEYWHRQLTACAVSGSFLFQQRSAMNTIIPPMTTLQLQGVFVGNYHL